MVNVTNNLRTLSGHYNAYSLYVHHAFMMKIISCVFQTQYVNASSIIGSIKIKKRSM